MGHPGLNFVKQINSDRFDLKSFIANHLEEFFKQLNLYIQSLHKYDKRKEIIIPSKRINAIMIVNALEKILPSVKQSDFPISSARDIDSIFSFLLHPDTPSDVHIPSSVLFKNFAKKLDDNILQQLNVSFYFLIPFSKLARNDEEYQNVIKNYPKNVCGLNSGGNSITTEEAYSETAEFFKFIVDIYLLKNVKSPIQFLFNEVFPTIYHKQIQYAGYQNKKTTGFNNPAPSRLHNEVLNFFDLVRQSKCNLLPFGDTKEKIKILLAILSDSSGQNGDENAEITFSIMNIFTQEPLFGNFKIQNQLYTLIETVISLMNSFSQETKKNSNPKAALFLSNLIYSEFKSMNGEDLTINMLTYMYQKASNEPLIILVQESAMLFVINNKINNQKIWDIIVSQIKSKPIAAVSSCRFSMYLATLLVPLFYKINIEETINLCSTISLRSKRNRLVNNYDFVAENIEMICKEPSKFVSSCLELGFKPLAQYVSFFEGYPFPEIRYVPTKLEGIVELKNFLLPHFDFLSSDNMDGKEQENLFSIKFTYYYTILKLQRFPLEIKFDHTAFLSYYGKLLIEFCLKSNLLDHINKAVFSLLAEAINDSFLQSYVNSSVLTHWYMILYLYILSNNNELSETAFIAASKTLRIGFVGSTILIPLLLYSLENGLVSTLMNMKPEEKRDRTTSLIDMHIGTVIKESNDSSKSLLRAAMGNVNNNLSKYLKDRNGDLASPVVGFLSMAPLFQHYVKVPDSFINYIKQMISANPNNFHPKSSDIINQITTPNDNYISSVLNCFKMFKNCCCVVTAASVLIVNEIVKENPNIQFINSLLSFYNDPIIIIHSVETLNCLMGMMEYFQTLNKICQDAVLQLVTNLTNETVKITYADPPDWIYTAITTLLSLLIHTYPIVKSTDNAQRFCQFLTTFSSSPDKPENYIENLISLAHHSIDLMSVYYGSYPFPNSSIFPSNMSLTADKDNFYYIGNHTLVHASAVKKGEGIDNSDDEVQIDVINEVGKFSYAFKSISNDLFKEEKIDEIDIPLNSEKEESARIEKQYISEITEPPSISITQYEETERNGSKLPTDVIDGNDPEILQNIKNIIEAKEKMMTGKLERPKIRPFSSVNKLYSAYTPLSIFNFINFANKEKVKKIENTKASKVLLDKIENHSHRIRMKIGIVYVGLHKDDQDMIFSTKLEDTSNQFKEFLIGLGYPINLSTHSPLYNGGLDLKGERSGKTSIYYTDFNNEIMFHVGPLLPTSETDSQQVLKKRHIGNDHIYIIYVDNDHDYNPSTISSQFGMMQIIVYPIRKTGLYRIEIYSRENEVPYFGPLRNGTVVQKRALPSLVRSTAIVAMMNLWCQQKEFFHPTIELALMIDELSKKHSVNDDDNSYKAIEELLAIRPDC